MIHRFWAEFSNGHFCIINKAYKSETNLILYMLGIIKLNMPEFVFQMDNSRVHTSKFATKFFNENHVKVLK